MTVSESTKKAYQQRIDRIQMELYRYMKGIDMREGSTLAWDYEFDVSDYKLILGALNDEAKLPKAKVYGVETKKGYLSALMWAIADKESEAFKAYHAEFDKVKKECIERAKEQKLPEARQQNYLNKDELIELYQKCYTKFLATGQDYYDHLVLALYIIQPPVRCDYVKMKFIDRDIPEFDKDSNYCLMDKASPCKFIFNRYKTSKTYGTVALPIEKDLQDLLRLHYYERKEKYVLPDHWDENYLSRKVRDICEKYTSKKCSIGLIRHAWVFDLYKTNPTLHQKEDLAKRMLHSVAVQELYRTAENVEQLSLEE
jgi:hypothetical protein